MEPQTRLGRQLTLPRHGIVAIDHGQRFEQVAARLGKAIVDVDELPPGMGQAVRQDRLQLARQVARQRIAHLDRRRQLLGAVLEHLRQVLARVPAAAEEQRDPMAVAQCDHARGVQAGPLLGDARIFRRTEQRALPAACPISSRILTVVSSLCSTSPCAACRINSSNAGVEVRRDGLHDVPLGRGRQRNLQVPLQAFEAVERQSAAVFQQPDHAAGRGVVLLLASLVRRGCREHLAAQMATQFLQLVNRRRQRRLPGDPHQHARGLLVDGALTAGGTRVARSERRMRTVNPRGTPVSLGAVAAVTLRGSRAVGFVDSAGFWTLPSNPVSAAAARSEGASDSSVFSPTTASVFSVRAPKNSWRSRRIEVFLSSTSSVT